MTDGLKDFARKAAFAARKAAFHAGQGHAADLLAQVLAEQGGRLPLAGYMPIRTEIDPRPAMASYAGSVGVPVVIGAGQPLAFHQWSPDCAMDEGAFGAAVPRTAIPMTPGIVIVPLLAFDRRGYRLGYGGGFYDRTLQQLRQMADVLAIGFAFSAQEVEEVPIDANDQPLDLIVTQAEVIRPV